MKIPKKWWVLDDDGDWSNFEKEADARKYAEDLVLENPGEEVILLKAVSICSVPTTSLWQEID